MKPWAKFGTIFPKYLFAFCVQSRRGFVQQKHLWVPDQGPCDGNSLLLASRKLGTFFPEFRVVALKFSLQNCFPLSKPTHLRQFGDKVVDVGFSSCFNYLGFSDLSWVVSIGDVFCYGAAEQVRLLRDNSQMRPAIACGKLINKLLAGLFCLTSASPRSWT